MPFHVTKVSLLNPVPVAVSVKAEPPDIAIAGEILVSVKGRETLKTSDAG